MLCRSLSWAKACARNRTRASSGVTCSCATIIPVAWWIAARDDQDPFELLPSHGGVVGTRIRSNAVMQAELLAETAYGPGRDGLPISAAMRHQLAPTGSRRSRLAR